MKSEDEIIKSKKFHIYIIFCNFASAINHQTMIYPSVGQYTEAIKLAEQSPEDYFATMTTLRPVLGADGNPVMSGGNFAVVFKMQDQTDGKIYALKCFTRDQEGRNESYRLIADELQYVESEYLTKIQYLEKELFVDTGTDDTEFPVLLMDWVEGETLDKYIRKNIDDKYSLSMLAFRFSRLAMWLMPQPFAHGDLKPDNIIVRSDGTLTLVDYDGMFVPAMIGQKSRELGSPDFRHPLRTEDDFDEHIDDFSLSTILLSLKAISLQPSLLEEYGAADRLLFSERDYRNISESKVLDALKPLMQDSELTTLLSMFLIALTQKDLSQVSSRLFNLKKPKVEDYPDESLSTKVTKEDIDNGIEDEYGVVYSKDGARLLRCNNEHLEQYSIREGVKVICNAAFRMNPSLLNIIISKSVISIGRNAFFFCIRLQTIILPNGIKTIEEGLFFGCDNLQHIVIPNSVTHICEGAFMNCKSLQTLRIPNSVYSIGPLAFRGCKSMNELVIPDSITEIGYGFISNTGIKTIKCLSKFFVVIDETLYNRDKSCIHSYFGTKQHIIVPNSVSIIGKNAYQDCLSLLSIIIPGTITQIEEGAFKGCSSLQCVKLSDGVIRIGESAFEDCISIQNISIPDSVESIGKFSFKRCISLQNIILSLNITNIDDSTFLNCESLQSISIPNRVLSIESNAFNNCISLKNLSIPESVLRIGYRAFFSCSSLQNVTIPNSVESVYSGAFASCCSLQRVVLSDKLKYLADDSFFNCNNLQEVMTLNGNISLFAKQILKKDIL